MVELKITEAGNIGANSEQMLRAGDRRGIRSEVMQKSAVHPLASYSSGNSTLEHEHHFDKRK